MRTGVLVTGGSGFVGSEIVRELLKSEINPIAVTTRRHSAQESPRIHLNCISSINRNTNWLEALENVRSVIHCAARVHQMTVSPLDLLNEFREVNVEGTLNLAKQAAESGVQRFVFMSSIKVNGERTLPGQKFRPEDIPNPEDSYAISKYEAEKGLTELSSRTGMEVVIIRPPLVYGPGVKGNFATIVEWIRQKKPLPLSCVKNERSYIAVRNLANFTLLCADVRQSPMAANEIFLVSDGEEISTPNLIRKIAQAYDTKPSLIPVPSELLRLGAKLPKVGSRVDRLTASLVVDNTKMLDRLNWQPVISMDEQLREMAKYDQSN